MKASELRLGNWVNNNPRDGVITVFSNDKCVIRHKAGIDRAFIEELQPIPLTKEWLLNLGFKKDVDGSFMKNDISIFLDKRFKTNLFLQENQDNFKWFSYECKIQYVHQLQNLYFALTGDELIILS